MIRLPNKLYRFNETVLADFVVILTVLGEESMPVVDLHQQLMSRMSTEDVIDALTLLLALGKLRLESDEGAVSRVA